ncbi:MAG TPA: thioredoxin-disulfide reductase [bacterium]
MSTDYEIIIIGGGPAGLTAGIYAARARRKTVLLEKHGTGGQMALTWEVENYPGVEKINGYELGQRMEQQARSFGLEIRSADVTGIASAAGVHRVGTSEGELTCRALVLAAGARHNRLGVPGEAEFTGHGVSYCGTCDGAFYQGVPVAVVGGGDTALQEALFLTRFASRVFLVHRRNEFRAAKCLQERVAAEPKIEPVLESVVERIEGGAAVTGVALKNVRTGAASHLAAEGAFIFVGTTPNTEFLAGFVPLDAQGFIPTTPNLETPVPGVFAAGDCRVKALRQISTAVGDGALAATMADDYLSQ